MEITTRSPEETQEVGYILGEAAQPGDLFLLTGELGSGKTCLTQGIVRGLGAKEWARSPTFVLVNLYHGRVPIYHIDLYRVGDTAEVLDMGLEEYLSGQGVCIVEWAEKAMEVFPGDHMLVRLEYVDENSRRLTLEANGPRSEALLSLLASHMTQSPGIKGSP